MDGIVDVKMSRFSGRTGEVADVRQKVGSYHDGRRSISPRLSKSSPLIATPYKIPLRTSTEYYYKTGYGMLRCRTERLLPTRIQSEQIIPPYYRIGSANISASPTGRLILTRNGLCP